MGKLRIKIVAEQLEQAKQEFKNLLPVQFQEDFEKTCFLAGGAIFSAYNGEEPKDYDFFTYDKLFADAIHTYFSLVSNLKYKNGVKIGTYKGKKLVVTDNAVSIGGKFQLIIRWVGMPEEVVSNFDFKHNMYYYFKGEVGTLVGWSYIQEKELKFNDSRPRDICGCIIRTRKFIERGFKLTNSEMSRMLLKLHEVGFNEREMEILKGNDERNDFGS